MKNGFDGFGWMRSIDRGIKETIEFTYLIRLNRSIRFL